MKIEVIVSASPIIYNELSSLVPPPKNVVTKWLNDEQNIEDFLDSHSKIDLLILDKIYDKKLESIAKKRFDIVRPFRMNKLVEVVEQSRSELFIYDSINKEAIYDEEASMIKYPNENISLTDKENTLMRALVDSSEKGLSKEDLLKGIWGYSSDAESSTIETYISRLRSRLPDGALVNEDGRVFLSTYRI